MGETLEFFDRGAGKEASGQAGLVSPDAQARLNATPELDYLTHIVMRLYENKRCAPPTLSRSPCSGCCVCDSCTQARCW